VSSFASTSVAISKLRLDVREPRIRHGGDRVDPVAGSAGRVPNESAAGRRRRDLELHGELALRRDFARHRWWFVDEFRSLGAIVGKRFTCRRL
jgi:hypothetical protein